MSSSLARAGVAVVAGLLAGSVVVRVLALGGQTPPAGQERPIFRGGANLVTVDAYPRRDGRIVEGLTPADFEVTEDGQPQVVDQFEFVRVEPGADAEYRDPNNQREALALAADPHNRVFVVYLDAYHVTVDGSRAIGRPLVDMLGRILAPRDLFGVMTPKMRPRDLVLARQKTALEEYLITSWTWGLRDRLTRDPQDGQEPILDMCFALDPISHMPWKAVDDGAERLLADIVIDRRREDRTLTNIEDLITYLGTIRESRTAAIVVTDGWRLFRRDETLVNEAMKGGPPPLPPITVMNGRLGTDTRQGGPVDRGYCTNELVRLAQLDNDVRLRSIIRLANQSNVVFHTVNPGGLDVFDTSLRTNTPMLPSMNRHNDRVSSVMTLSGATDGISVTGTNDLKGGLAKIANDSSAYYLLGYYSTNPKFDGKLRQIKVRVKRQGVSVAARRNYLAPANAPAPSGPPSAAAVRTAASAAAITEALGALSRLGFSAELRTFGTVQAGELAIITEIPGAAIEQGKWAQGGDLSVRVTGVRGESIGAATGKIEPGTRGALVRVPIGSSTGPWAVAVGLVGTSGLAEDRIDVRADPGKLVGRALLFRGSASPRVPLRPVADLVFRRTERVHLEWPALMPLDERLARLLDQRGQPLPLELTLTLREDGGRALVVADLNLGPLAPGDYLIELATGSGAVKETTLTAIRVVR